MDDRAGWVDYAKAIGIILVVYGHVIRGLHSAGFEFYGKFYDLSDSIIYSFHMPLFFFLSGLFFFHTLSKKGRVGLVYSKIDTIFYPYIIWSIFQGSIEALLSNYTNGNVLFSDVFSLFWAPRAQFWFLYDLFFIFVFLSLMLKTQTKSRTLILFFSLVVFYCFFIDFLSYVEDRTLLLCCVFFISGILFNFYFKGAWLKSKTLLLITTVFFISSQYMYHFYYSLNYLDYSVYTIVLAFISVLFVILLSFLLSQIRIRFLAYLGVTSMAIYLMHILAGSGIRVILYKVFGIESTVIHLVFGVVAGLLFPLIGLWVINKLKLKFVFSAPMSSFFPFAITFFNAKYNISKG
jgi:fucose 4-O-acetylase-like acetyltransferase